MRFLVEIEPFVKLKIEPRRLVPGVDQLDAKSELFSIGKVLLSHFSPVGTHCFRNLRVTVTGEIDEIEVIIYQKIVDALSSSRSI